MKNFFLTLVLISMGAISIAQTSLYEHPKFEEYAKTHETIAILPFNASITLRPKDMKSMSVDQLEKMEQAEGISVQNGMHSWFLKRDKKGNSTVAFQDPITTNAKLKKFGVTFENFDEFTPNELADILEVHAIIMGTFETNKPMSEGANLALNLLVGFGGASNKAILNMNLYDGEEGVLLANYNKSVSGSLGSSTEDMINVLMKKASRRISYSD
ncbi:hypothetical protein SYJ56_15310 [Algoriphagus sp. D3-2-R+10]|uniref:hypothetical protein n=1 Tax=Algoriphagus aurantiacus TaxID=3103948 RepID=UPI002B36447F|nr:hypothetical protein [Algoriphagus sp. D3-2-R+10]MEB2776692.1 hypothetical protein [Algoriphagus sp. D3-2-R+10]